MLKRAASAFTLVLLAAASAGAQEPKAPAKMAGAWDFSFTSPQGSATWRVTFEQAGDTLAGQALTDFGTIPVVEGGISGNEFSFGLPLNFNGQTFTLYFSGAVKGDTAEGAIEVPNSGMPAFPFQAIRVPPGSDEPASALERPRKLGLVTGRGASAKPY